MITLRDYQQPLYDGARQAFKNHKKRVLIVAPCGAGKTFLFLKMCESAIERGGRVLVLCHRKELAQQHVELFTANGFTFENIRVALFWSEARHLGEHGKYTLIIADEAHWLPASLRNVLDFYDCPTIGLTATPVREDNALAEVFDELIVGVSVKWLIAHNRLAPYLYYSVEVADTLALKAPSHGDYSVVDMETLLMKPKIYSDVVQSYKRFADGKKTIVYCASVKHSTEVVQAFIAAGYAAAHMDANTPKAERDRIMAQFRSGEIQIISNVALIVEGISVPDCECCILLRPTQSLSVYIQSAMRCMRYKEGKTAVIIDCVANYLRHGMPDEDRDWKLSEPPKKRHMMNTEGKLTIRTCQYCFRVFATADKCPYCGAEYATTPRELKRMKEIQLSEIKATEAAKLEQERKARRAEQGRCRTLDDLIKLGISRGMKPNKAAYWARCVFHGRKKH